MVCDGSTALNLLTVVVFFLLTHLSPPSAAMWIAASWMSFWRSYTRWLTPNASTGDDSCSLHRIDMLRLFFRASTTPTEGH